jgi:hypothetical protein
MRIVPSLEQEVHYCYRCGKRVGKDMGKCYYCAAPTRRTIRPSRLCPFCEEPIGHKAVKCSHCGEFLDGRKKDEQQQPQQQAPSMTFVIDKAVFSDGRMQLPGGQGHPQLTTQIGPDGRPLPASAQQPMFPHQNPQQALPYQGTDSSQWQQAQQQAQQEAPRLPAPQESSRKRRSRNEPADSSAQPLAPYTAPPEQQQADWGGNPLAPYQGGQLAAQGQGNQLAAYVDEQGRPLAPYTGGANPLAPHAPPANLPAPFDLSPQRAKQAVESKAAEESKYAVCGVCGTEMLATDSYCFHCGQVQKFASEIPDVRIQTMESNAPLHIATIGFAAAFALVRNLELLANFNEITYWGPLALAALLIPVWAFFHRRTTFSQIITIAMAIAVVVSLIAFGNI